MSIMRSESGLREVIWSWRKDNKKIVFVPTMGALHEGHMSLVRLAKEKGDKVVVSIFVNPTQFAPGEDLDAYPRTENADTHLLKAEGVDMVYIPDPQTMYDVHHATSVTVGGVAKGLETDYRPTFFDGVTQRDHEKMRKRYARRPTRGRSYNSRKESSTGCRVFCC